VSGIAASKQRIHGDYHLGQVLRSRNDYVIIDFEGEPARPLTERRAKASPVKDVAGMIRSFSYAAYAGLFNHAARRTADFERLVSCARVWERRTASAFLESYVETARVSSFLPSAPGDLERLLELFLLEKTFYELRYELNNRPSWVRVPLQSLLDTGEGR
jgi:maltose alpha-D-glucosyltransferase/alpha-amylase